ncbi:MAG: hypothetical protein EOM85_00465 [Candidatus Moranbacteria bacterium]|nr:hypothetical protein [Candidatus Moranbacteria bacterium]
MENESKKPRIQIRLGGLVILIIIALILFKVDIKDKIESPQFQKNVTYITAFAKDVWQNYIALPLQSKANTWFMGVASDGLEKIQDSIKEKSDGLLDTKNIQKSFNKINNPEEE